MINVDKIPSYIIAVDGLKQDKLLPDACKRRPSLKKQQMRLTQKGAHLLLQVRTQTLNDDLWGSFARWYPRMASASTSELTLAV